MRFHARLATHGRQTGQQNRVLHRRPAFVSLLTPRLDPHSSLSTLRVTDREGNAQKIAAPLTAGLRRASGAARRVLCFAALAALTPYSTVPVELASSFRRRLLGIHTKGHQQKHRPYAHTSTPGRRPAVWGGVACGATAPATCLWRYCCRWPRPGKSGQGRDARCRPWPSRTQTIDRQSRSA